jgi:hypothetical protein
MKNNLNEKNKSISKSKSKSKSKDTNKNNIGENIVLINEQQINIIPSQSTIKISSSNKHKSNSKKSKQKRIINTKIAENFVFPKGHNYKCIGPCYPANMLYYHPLTLQAIKSKHSSCPIEVQKIGNKVKIRDECTLNENYDYESYDMFSDVVQVATSDNIFLEQIYDIKNIYDVELFLENNIKQLPNLSQKRILNSIYRVYRDNDSFPNNNFISLVKNLLNYYYGIDMKSKKIISKIMDNKHNKLWENIFENLVK